MSNLSEEEIIMVLKNHAEYTKSKVHFASTGKEYEVKEAIKRYFRFIFYSQRKKFNL